MKRKLLMVFVAVIAIVSMFTLVACGGNDGNTTNGDTVNSNQLSVVKNINYTADGYKFTWDKVQNADSYNIKINSENITQNGIKNNEFAYYPQDTSKDIKVQVQAVDSTGEYNKSEWSEEQSFTFEEQSTLMTNINNYAKNYVRGKYTGFVSASTYTDDYKDTYVVMNVISKLNGEDRLTVFEGLVEPGTDLISLEGIVKTNPEVQGREDYVIAVNDKGETINSMEYLLQSDINGTALKDNYINYGYQVDVVSSYTALDNGDAYGKNFTIYSVVRVSRGLEVKYLQVEYDCGIKNMSSSLETNVTNGLLGSRYLQETTIQELTGDFAEAAWFSSNVTQ